MVVHFRSNPAIKVWQVENEPLDASGAGCLRIDDKFLKNEIEHIKKLDSKRQILVNLWGNELGKRKLYKKVLKYSEIIGLDIYFKHEFSVAGRFIKYIGPLDSINTTKKIADKIRKSNAKLWIIELQAEPWEPKELISQKKNPPSFLPKHFEKNLKYVLELKPKVVLLWGFEYWYWRRLKMNDERYWNEAKRIINKYSTA